MLLIIFIKPIPYDNWKKKKKQNLEIENYILFSPLAEDLGPEGNLS